MSDLKPGMLVRVRYGSVDQLALVRPRKAANGALEFAYVSGGFDMVDGLSSDASVRPLVALDLPERLIGPLRAGLTYALREEDGNDLYSRRPHGEYHAVRRVLEAVEAQTTPPKPAEPTGLGAVVEDAEGGRWVRCDETESNFDNPWHGPEQAAAEWAEINAVRVLSEGVTA